MENQAWEWAEKQMDSAFSFYKEEVDARKWYGLFDYGDIMHTYDSVRHIWKYDMGGFAWQNTELVPTYWLWLYFLRTGREDVFSMAEAMSRHCSETDIYHIGSLRGMGSRHNVRHWGCPCKEPRISMAGHWRLYYYLTGDHRLGEVMDEEKDAENALRHVKHYQEDGRLVIRSGPDWSSYVANWMTRYEGTLDQQLPMAWHPDRILNLIRIHPGLSIAEKMKIRQISIFRFAWADCRYGWNVPGCWRAVLWKSCWRSWGVFIFFLRRRRRC